MPGERSYVEILRVIDAIVPCRPGDIKDVCVLEPTCFIAHPVCRTLRPVCRSRIGQRQLLTDPGTAIVGKTHNDELVALLEDVDFGLISILGIHRRPVTRLRCLNHAGRTRVQCQLLQGPVLHPHLKVSTRRC